MKNKYYFLFIQKAYKKNICYIYNEYGKIQKRRKNAKENI